MLRSNYLVNTYKENPFSLYSSTLFKSISDAIKNRHKKKSINVLDIGCADKRAYKSLLSENVSIQTYIGIDIEQEFKPDLVADIREFQLWYPQLTVKPDVILVTDVLEHLDGGLSDIHKTLEQIESHMTEDQSLIIVFPQLYRLDCFKLDHLEYSEHKIRLTSFEWISTISKHFEIISTQGTGYLSSLPYLPMASKYYKEENWMGALFKSSRKFLNKQKHLQKYELIFSSKFGKNAILQNLANSVIVECVKRKKNKNEN